MKELELHFHWPHDRLAIGFETIRPDESFDFFTLKLYLTIFTITINF